MFIGGVEVEATSGETFTTVNPATGETLATVARADAADVDRAVASAREGFAIWSAMTGAARGRIMLRAAAILRERNDELAHLEVLDTGKPIAEASVVDVGGPGVHDRLALLGTIRRPHQPRPRYPRRARGDSPRR